MLYSEFIQGTGCKESEYNFQVYKNLEIMYMNSDLTKSEIYEYGKKLVDNSKSQKMIDFEMQIKNEIKELKNHLAFTKNEIKYYESMAMDSDESFKPIYRADIKRYKAEIKNTREKIAQLNSILAEC